MTAKETARCPVCGEMHEVVKVHFNGMTRTMVPCPKVPRDVLIPFPISRKEKVMSNRFSYVLYDGVRAEKQQQAKALVESLEAFLDAMGTGRPHALALTALEECYMWIGKAIRDEQIAFDGACVEETHRGEEGVNVEPKA